MTEPPSGIEIVQAFMKHINIGDLDSALAYVHADVHISEPPSMPYGGEYRGHEQFAELMRKIGQTWASWRETPNRFAESGSLVFRECTVRGRLRGNGVVVEMPFVELFEIERETIVAMRPHYWDPGLLRQEPG
ncbi:hypothetical protein Aple_001600 [Acrocarpospora pleiomorpha]|uniref:SnoaL-like domain-containing protein n=1 Tax=Acrocarpospora pleiomorpha TaxID=90975 RepID=A0A5M3X6E9_9ACTN|nr:nuclear transport factor 2 family protein [Acrocarpospora pleiomorpha]GES17265.1 hypothetical protein Aple_001600 [Acrocarpospora pleiomorpha]